jgi:hypothetical protein
MCCFSGKVQKVADTKIFARGGKEGKQFLVYSMVFSSKEDLAMILPLPTPKGSGEKAVKFISLKDYPDFFKDMHKPFVTRGKGKGGKKKDDSGEAGKKLEVVKVGNFEASFVPTVKDFARLDERFKLPKATWDDLPGYKDYGFAVFKLKKGEQKVHPMAFEFPRKDKEKLFFPTVHIHDGKVHKTATFDHALYLQPTSGEDLLKWKESPGLANSYLKIDKTAGIVEKDAHLYYLALQGKLKNEDTWVS